jgi:transposase InsO family protein
LTIQEFNFAIRYIKGPLNIVADKMSRLCSLHIETGEIDHKVLFINALYDRYIPDEIRHAFNQVHNAVVGHNGINKTYRRMRQMNIKHDDLKSMIRRLKKECKTCQKDNVNQVIVNTMPFTTASYDPMECLSIDTIGPFREDRLGYKYVLNMIDTFTRFQHLIPTRDVDAQSALEALIKHVGLFGIPNDVQSDNASQFINEAVKDLQDRLGCRHINTTPYSKEQNAIVERSNKENNRYLTAIVQEHDCLHEWSIYLPLVQRIINSQVHESIGVTPAQLVFPHIDLDRMFPFEEEEHNKIVNLSDYMKNVYKLQEEFINIAKLNQKERDEEHLAKHFQKYNDNDNATPFEEGGYVLLSHPNKKKPHKLAYAKTGPYKITKINNRDVTIMDLTTSFTRPVDISRLAPFHYDVARVNPEVIAAQDKQMFIVEQILSHKKVNNNYSFRVKWEGYDDPTDITWEPYTNLKNNSVFHTYCKDNNLHSLIPRQFRIP